ncbi:hypothetical protein AgCh_021037 [Apium graveolens]
MKAIKILNSGALNKISKVFGKTVLNMDKEIYEDPSILKTSQSFLRLPSSTHHFKEEVGLAGHYRRFVQVIKIVAPLTRLTRKTEKFEWTEKCENSFQELKQRLVMAPMLALPDGKRRFCDFVSDASHKELGCFLAQQDNRVCVKTIKKELNIRQRRRLELIKNYNWEILYHSGKANMVADALSKKERLKMMMSFGEFIRDFEKMEIVVKVTGAGTEKLFEIAIQPELLEKIILCQKKL